MGCRKEQIESQVRVDFAPCGQLSVAVRVQILVVVFIKNVHKHPLEKL